VSTSAGIVIVGGGLAAARTAEQLRRSEYAGPVTIVSDEDHLPYDRPPLSKEVLRAEVDDVAYDELIIATGLVPRTIPSFPDLEGIRVLRSLEESIALREHAGSAGQAVVVGAGFIGCEVAASLRGMGVKVVLVEPQPTPLASVLGEQIGALVTRLHRCGRGTGHRPCREGRAVGRNRVGRRSRRRRNRLQAGHRLAPRQWHRTG
jgi:NADPH-dependent 2,4-dienoyl-CoA reductase/sulfur reductase-like enzyme